MQFLAHSHVNDLVVSNLDLSSNNVADSHVACGGFITSLEAVQIIDDSKALEAILANICILGKLWSVEVDDGADHIKEQDHSS